MLNGSRDGLFKTNIDDIEIWLTQLSGFVPRRIPKDTLLTFETQLLAKIALAVKPAVIHAASGFRGYENALKGLALARSLDLPFVYEVRSFHEHCWREMADGILDMPLTKMRKAQEDRCLSEADSVVTISDAMAERLRSRGVDASRLFVVPNSIERRFLELPDPLAVTRFREQWQLDNVKVIGYVSNISKCEGHSILCEAFAAIHAQNADTKLLIVGDGPQREETEKLVQSLGIAEAVVFTGSIDHAEIVEAYEAIDIFVVPRLPDPASDCVTPMKSVEAADVGQTGCAGIDGRQGAWVAIYNG